MVAVLAATGCGEDRRQVETPGPDSGISDAVPGELLESGSSADSADELEERAGTDESPTDASSEPGKPSDGDEPSTAVEPRQSEGAELGQAEPTDTDPPSNGAAAEDPGTPGPRTGSGIAVVDCPAEQSDPVLECGLVTVPVDRGDPTSGTINISVVVRPGSGDATLPPLAVLQGGPGGASSDLAVYLPSRSHPQVFIDQRGTGFGSADFSCPEVLEALPELLEATKDEADAIESEAYGRCVDRLSDHPALAHTTTAALAADVADAMAGLGYGRWFVYGVSYGTTIALEMLRDPPDGLAGAVLDGVYPPTLDLDRDIALAAQRVMGELDVACAADPACVAVLADAPGGERATVSGLASEVIARVNAEPFTVSLGARDTSIGEDVDVWLDGDSVASVLHEILYVEDWIGLVPGLVAGLARGSESAATLLAFLGVELSAISLDANALGTYFAVTCADRLPFTSGPPPAEEVGDFAAAIIGEGVAAGCERWPVDPSPPSAAEAVTSDLPVVLLSGRFDPITPPDFAAAAAEHLGRSTSVVRDGASHGTWGFDSCVDGIVTDFMADPAASPDISCAEEQRLLNWIPIP